MAKTESTAVNALIDLVQKRPVGSEPAPDLFGGPKSVGHPARMTSTIPPLRGAGEVAPLPRGRAPAATSQHELPTRGTTIPPLAPPPRAASGTAPPPSRAGMPAPLQTVNPFTATVPQQFPVVQPPDRPADHWYEAGASIENQVDASWTPAPATRSRADTPARVNKLIAPTLALAVAGVMVGGLFAFDGQGGQSGQHGNNEPNRRARPEAAPALATGVEDIAERPAPPRTESDNAATASAGGSLPEPPSKAEQAAEIAAATAGDEAAVDASPARAVPAAAPEVREVQTSRGMVKLIDVRIDSSPSGATVTLVDRGKQTFLGSTPLATAVDGAREYDVIVSLDGRPAQMVHLDPTKSTRIDVSLGGKPNRSGPARVGRAVKADADAGVGTLMVSSKPPCEIYIDDKPTGLTTPQRSIELPAGTHKITFVNENASIRKSVSVKIAKDQPTKLIQNLMAP